MYIDKHSWDAFFRGIQLPKGVGNHHVLCTYHLRRNASTNKFNSQSNRYFCRCIPRILGTFSNGIDGVDDQISRTWLSHRGSQSWSMSCQSLCRAQNLSPHTIKYSLQRVHSCGFSLQVPDAPYYSNDTEFGTQGRQEVKEDMPLLIRFYK